MRLLDGRSSQIAEDRQLLAEVTKALPALRQEATQPASEAEIIRILSQRFALYPQPDRTDGEWAAWWADYTNALDDLPPSAIEAGMAEYVKGSDSEFFPKPGRIRELAKTSPNRMAMAVEAARNAIRHAEVLEHAKQRSEAPTAPQTEADKDRVRAMLAEFARQMAEKAPKPKPAPPPVSGPVDEQGLTQLMRQRLAERDQRA